MSLRAEDPQYFKRMGETITAMREQRGLLLTELAELAGLSLERLEKIEAGEVDARWSELQNISYALENDLPQLVQESEMRP